MNLQELWDIAESVKNEPWGCGEPLLADTESAPPYYRFLYKVVKKYKPWIVVECGTYLGIGVAHMASACKYTEVITENHTTVITIDQVITPRARRLAEYYRNMVIFEGDTTSQDAANFVGRFGLISLLFLDSEHDGFTAQRELDVYQPMFANECLVCCDDILDPRMLEFWVNLPDERIAMNQLHQATYPGYPDCGFGVSIFRRINGSND